MSRELKVLLPVIDLLDGQVVHAVAGERESYLPVRSVLTELSEPAAVARALAERCSCTDIYVADLDAISGRDANVKGWTAIESTGASLLLDAGVHNVAELVSVRNRIGAMSQLVVGLENFATPKELQETGSECTVRDIFSLDLRCGQPIVSSDWNLSPLQIATRAVEAGFRRIIVLDVAQVGTGQGSGTLELIANIRTLHCDVELIGGGGVHTWQDVEWLVEAGCSRVLVASALHKGWL